MARTCVCVCVCSQVILFVWPSVFVRDDVMRGRLDISVCVCVSVWAVQEVKACISKNSLSDSVCVCVCVCGCICICERETGHWQKQ